MGDARALSQTDAPHLLGQRGDLQDHCRLLLQVYPEARIIGRWRVTDELRESPVKQIAFRNTGRFGVKLGSHRSDIAPEYGGTGEVSRIAIDIDGGKLFVGQKGLVLEAFAHSPVRCSHVFVDEDTVVFECERSDWLPERVRLRRIR